jgi:UDP:flavonoid glycosyltransferase YjiC (YdhE family)
MRVLMTTTSGAGHVGPLLPFAPAIAAAGGEVLVAAGGPAAEVADAAALPVHVLAEAPPERREPHFAAARRDPRGNVHPIVVEHIFAGADLWAALPGVVALCRRWRPDVIVHESCEFAAVLAAELCDVPRVRVAIGTAATEQRVLDLATPVLEARRRELGLARDPAGARLRDVRSLTLCPRALDEDVDLDGPPPRRFRLRPTGPEPLPELWPGDDRPLVYLSFGSVVPGTQLFPGTYRAAIDALSALPVRVLVAVGRHADPARLGPLPDGVRALGWVQQGDVMAHASAVACHGGSGTVQPALATGVPLAVLPMFADQPHNARRVVAHGAGVAVWGGPAAAGELGPAVERLLTDARFADRARAVAAELDALPTPDAAVEDLRAVAGLRAAAA